MIDAKTISEVRSRTGAGIVECKKALEEANGDVDRACDELRKKGMAKAEKRGHRDTKAGLVYAYIHQGGQVGALIEVQCETDFVARTEAFQGFVHDLGLQVAAMSPTYLVPADVPAAVSGREKDIVMAEFVGSSKPAEVIEKIAAGKMDKFYSEICLMNQAFIKDEDKTISDLVKEMISKTGENIKVIRFARFALGETNPASEEKGEACGAC